MRSHRLHWFVLALFLAALTLPAVARAAEPQKVLSVITVKVSGDRQAYLAKLKTFQSISTRLGLPTPRVWRGSWAGEATDLIYIAVEYPSLAALAEASSKLAADAEATKFTRDLDASGTRTVVNRSVMVDETPQ